MDVQKFASAIGMLQKPDVKTIHTRLIQESIKAGKNEVNVYECLSQAGYEYDSDAGMWKKQS